MAELGFCTASCCNATDLDLPAAEADDEARDIIDARKGAVFILCTLARLQPRPDRLHCRAWSAAMVMVCHSTEALHLLSFRPLPMLDMG